MRNAIMETDLCLLNNKLKSYENKIYFSISEKNRLIALDFRNAQASAFWRSFKNTVSRSAVYKETNRVISETFVVGPVTAGGLLLRHMIQWQVAADVLIGKSELKRRMITGRGPITQIFVPPDRQTASHRRLPCGSASSALNQ